MCTTLQKKNIDFLTFRLPGIYEILNVKTNKSYYGETEFLGDRFVRHIKDLEQEIHANKNLLTAFKEQNKDLSQFCFIILESGSEWNCKEKRVKKQNEYIQQNKDRCYNTLFATTCKELFAQLWLMVKNIRV